MRMSCLRSSPILKKTLTFDPSASAFTKESFRGTALELKNEQDCRGEVHSSHPHPHTLTRHTLSPHPSHPHSPHVTPSLLTSLPNLFSTRKHSTYAIECWTLMCSERA